MAVSGPDYTTRTGTLSIAVGVTSKIINIPIRNDSEAEAMESFTVSLSSPSVPVEAHGNGSAA